MLILSAVLLPVSLSAQFDGAAGTAGSKAISYDDPRFVEWAITCQVTRGYKDIAQQNLGTAAFGSETNVLGIPSSDDTMDCISLGDRGEAVMTFQNPIIDGNGYDFAVFENGFGDTFLELALVYVSSNGTDWFDFPSTSNTPTNVQTGSYGGTDPTKLNNIAGKYRIGFGTPFDLSEIPDNPNLDKNNIRYVKVVDVVGTIDPNYATYDHQGNIINDPYPTAFDAGGFDLSGVGVINRQSPETGLSEGDMVVSVFPNPCTDRLYVKADNERLVLYSIYGQKLYEEAATNAFYHLDMTKYPDGVYLLELHGKGTKRSVKVVKK